MRVLFLGDYLPNNPIALRRLGSGRLAVANLECAISFGDAARLKACPIVVGEKVLENVVRSGFAAVNLANNHVCDAGAEALPGMCSALRRGRWAKFYGFCDAPYAVLEEGGMRCAVIGCLERCRARGPGIFPEEKVERLIAQVHSEFHRVFVTPHWGKEGEYAFHPSPRQCALARSWIDAGADGISAATWKLKSCPER